MEKIFPCIPLKTSRQSREQSEEEGVADVNSYELTATLLNPSHILLLGLWSQKGKELGINRGKLRLEIRVRKVFQVFSLVLTISISICNKLKCFFPS